MQKTSTLSELFSKFARVLRHNTCMTLHLIIYKALTGACVWQTNQKKKQKK